MIKKSRQPINRNFIFSFFAILIFLGSSLYIYHINFIESPSPYMAKKGIIDLSDWDMTNTIDLDGEWEFYPQLLINPQEEGFNEYKTIKKLVNIPGDWKKYISQGEDSDGAGTYRLKIKLPEDNLYGVKTRTIRLANKVFINNQESITTGKPSLDKEGYIPDSKYKIGFGSSKDNEIDLLIQVSSYGYRSGGILKPIEFGSSESILRRDRRDRIVDGIIISICLVLGLYFF